MEFIVGTGIFSGALLLVIITIPIVKTLVEEIELLDSPEEGRKVHRGEVPTLGGVAIFIGFFIPISFTGIVSSLDWFTIFSGIMVLLLFTGLKDDVLGIDAKKKLLIEVIAAAAITMIGGVYISHFGGLLGIEAIPYWVAIPFSMFVLIVLTNAYNLIDGVDGLAGGVGTIISLALATWFFSSGYAVHGFMSIALAGALIGFLYYNFAPASIFMGDTGSLVTGFVISILSLEAIQLGTTNSDALMHGNVPVLVMAILSVPLYDTLRVTIIRAIEGRSVFEPGNDHIHHEILKLGFGHRSTSSVFIILNLITIGFVSVLSFLPSTLLFIITSLFVLLLYPSFGIKRKLIKKFFGVKFQRFCNHRDYGQHEINRKLDQMQKERERERVEVEEEAYS